MAHPSPDLAELARNLVLHEAGSSEPSATAAAVERACTRLKEDLTGMLGSGGVSALMRRSINLARQEHPILTGVALGPPPSADIIGLQEALAKDPDGQASAAGAAILSHFLTLLVVLLGDELGLQPVGRFWPHLMSNATEGGE